MDPETQSAPGSDPARDPPKAGDAHCDGSLASNSETGNVEEALRFLRMLFGDSVPAGKLGVGSLYYAKWFSLDDAGLQAAARYSLGHDAKADTYFHTCAHTPVGPSARGRKATATYAAFLWADIDFHKDGNAKKYPSVREVLRCLRALKIPPSVVVVTGGGLHCYWLLDEPIPASEAECLCKRLRWYIIATLGGDCTIDAKWDASTILRVPGTRNHKHSYRVRIWKPHAIAHSCRRYKPDQIAALFGELGIQVSVAKKVVLQETPSCNPALAVAGSVSPDPDFDAYIRQGIEQTRPTGRGERHTCLCRFMVWAKGHPRLRDATATEAMLYCWRWYEVARTFVGTKEWEVTRREFLSGWPQIKWPRGSWKQQRFRNACARLDPRAIQTCKALRLRAKRMPALINLLIEFADATSDVGKFFLSGNDAGDYLGIAQPRAWCWLKKLEVLGVLTVVERGTKGIHGKATTFRLNLSALRSE